MKRFVVALGLLVGSMPAVAAADAKQDVQDIRAGRLPVRYDWLGWNGGTAHFRTLVCSEGGTTSCTARILKQSEVKTTPIELLSIQEVYCDGKSPCAALDAKTAVDFAGRERVALSALPSLDAGARVADPRNVLGNVAGDATTVAVSTRDESTPTDGPKLVVQLVVKGKGGAIETLGTLDPRVFRLNSSAIKGAHVSPDGKTAAFAIGLDVGVMCWDFAELSTLVVDVPHAKASLANTIGYRAYQKKDLAAALAGFSEATALDASYGLGWYNRASIESRNGDLAAAKASFTKAWSIDPTFAKRACKDPDFGPLQAADPSLFGC